MSKKIALIILDGWGIGDKGISDAIAHAHTPCMDQLLLNYPNSTLLTSGEDVGLPAGQMGNSEVGHLNIGAGRVVYQDLVRVNVAIREGKLKENPVLKETFEYCLKNSKPLHLMGLVSDGGVHSHQDHLHSLITYAKEAGIKEVYIHAFTDGRDTDPKSGYDFISKLQQHCQVTGANIATITGRYYAMDRDKRWERVKLAYDALVNAKGEQFSDPLDAIKTSYDNEITDEFIKPVIIEKDGKPLASIKPGDAVLCFNFRTDRCREITEVLTQTNMPDHGMQKLQLFYVTMTSYSDKYENVKVLFSKDNLSKTLGEVIAASGRSQIRIAETEKYPHVTFFFSGGREPVFENEKRIMIASPKVATYDLQPEMSAIEMTEAILPELKKAEADFICLNFANPDMVGHTGVFKAVVSAIETVDSCLKRIVEAGIENGYSFLIIADHGNADFMLNPDGTPNTAHTTNLVPCVLIDRDHKSIRNGRLADVAPTILKLLNIEKPVEMDGKSLI